MDLLSNLLDVRVRGLHLSHSRSRGHKNIFIHRCPEDQKTLQQVKINYTITYIINIITVYSSTGIYQICDKLWINKHITLVNAYIRTLCLPITKDTLRLQGLTKLDQLVSRMMYSPFRAQNRMDEWSNGCPAYWRTEGKAQKYSQITVGTDFLCRCRKFFLYLFKSMNSLFLWMASMIGRSFGCKWRRTGVPIRSWGRYPRRGTALIHIKYILLQNVQFPFC